MLHFLFLLLKQKWLVEDFTSYLGFYLLCLLVFCSHIWPSIHVWKRAWKMTSLQFKGHNERFRLTVQLPCFGVLAHGADTRSGRGGRWVCRLHLLFTHSEAWGAAWLTLSSTISVQCWLYRSQLYEVTSLCSCQSWLTTLDTFREEFCLDHFASLVEFVLINNSHTWSGISDCWDNTDRAGEVLYPWHENPLL